MDFPFVAAAAKEEVVEEEVVVVQTDAAGRGRGRVDPLERKRRRKEELLANPGWWKKKRRRRRIEERRGKSLRDFQRGRRRGRGGRPAAADEKRRDGKKGHPWHGPFLPPFSLSIPLMAKHKGKRRELDGRKGERKREGREA